MQAEDPTFTPDEITAMILRSAIPKLPEEISTAMLRDPEVLRRLDLPQGDFIELWQKRFEREKLLSCLRSLVNGSKAELNSYDGKSKVEEALLADDGAATLRLGKEVLRFPNVDLFSSELPRRQAVIAKVAETGELPEGREQMWRGAVEMGPLDDDLFIAFENEISGSAEATFREIIQNIGNGSATFDDLIPLNVEHYADLLGVSPLPASLEEFRAAWRSLAASFGKPRLLRTLRLSSGLALLPSGLIAEAAAKLEPAERLDLVKFLASRADPFSISAAFEIAGAHPAEPEMATLSEKFVEQICDFNDPVFQIAGPAFETAFEMTTALTARNKTFAGWPLYAKRIARILHAGQLLRVFRAANVDPAEFAKEVGARFGPQARIADLCDLAEAPYFQPQYLGEAMIQALMLERMNEVLGRISDAAFRDEGIAKRDKAVATAIDAGRGLHLLAAGPLDEFESEWTGLTSLAPEFAAECLQRLTTESDPSVLLNEVFKISLAFEVPDDVRPALGPAIVGLLSKFEEPANYLMTAEACLHIAARWRDEALSDQIVDHILGKVQSVDLIDPGAAPRIFLVSAAAVSERNAWLDRAGRYAQAFAYLQRPGPAVRSLLRAINLLSEFEPDLLPKLASAKSYTILAYDHR